MKKINTTIIDFNRITNQIKRKKKEKYNYNFSEELFIWLAQSIRGYLNSAFQNIQSEEQIKFWCCRMIDILKILGYENVEKDIPKEFRNTK